MAANKQRKGRDENGVRILEYKRFKEGVDFLPSTGGELNDLLDVCIANFQSMIKRNGRPPTFETVEQLQSAIMSYFEYIKLANEDDTRELKLIPDIEGLAAHIGVTRDTLNRWENDNYNNFSDTIKSAKNAIAAYKKQLGLHGKIPPLVLAMDMNNNHGYTQKQEVVVTPNSPLAVDTNPIDIASKYDTLPED